MESHGVPGKIQIARATYLLIKNQFVCAPRGAIEVKGKGKMDTWFFGEGDLVSRPRGSLCSFGIGESTVGAPS